MTDFNTVDPSSVDMEAEIAAAQQREEEFLGKGKQTSSEEPDPNAEPKARPDNVPEEFWNADKGEVDWEKLNDRLKNGEQPKTEEEQTDADAQIINGVKLTDQHSTDFQPFYDQFAKDGTVSADAVKYVKDTFNIDATPEMIGAYMRGQLNKADGQASEVATTIRTDGLAVVGGEQNYAAMSEWALDTLTEAEVAEYDAAVNGKDPKVAKLAVQALWNRYRAEGTIPPKVTLGKGRTSSTAGDAYSSIDEMVADTSHPKYDKDPAFRARVDAKIARSGSLAVPTY